MLCPYSWFKSIFKDSQKNSQRNGPPENLHVQVIKGGEEVVRVALPAQSARWLLELIPSEVVKKIYAEKIPLDAMLDEIKGEVVLTRRVIFSLVEPGRTVQVWLD